MTSFPITIDGQQVSVKPGVTVLDVARSLGLDIPTLCYLEKCGPLNSCLVCLVKINGKLVPSCGTKAESGMVVESETEEVHEARRTALELLFSDHIGDCLAPCHRLCPLGLNIPLMLRQIDSQQLDQAAATVRASLPLAGILGRLCHHPCEQGCRRGTWDDPAAIRDLERFVTDWEGSNPCSASAATSVLPEPPLAPNLCASDGERDKTGATPCGVPMHERERNATSQKPVSADPALLYHNNIAKSKSVVIIGAGPAGLAAAYYLARNGHRVTVVDRHERPGGSLRDVSDETLPRSVLDREILWLERAGIEFKCGVELGNDVRLDGLLRGFDAILVAVGEPEREAAGKLGLPFSGPSLKADPNTCQTPLAKVFAAGAVVKPVKQLVRAMAEGRAAAECIHRFLLSQPVRRPEKPFSSVMGRLSPGELRVFLAASNTSGSVTPCDRCAGYNRQEAATAASRCLHCDCASSGNCLLQHYAQVYSANASRFRTERKIFERYAQPGGVIFEPGKCILCGICVKLTELAREPLGLTFIGRGYDIRVSAPLNHSIEEGLQKTAEECVRHCPTGALTFKSTNIVPRPAP